ncbi:MAG: hypothetical protein M1821_000394 [Bathelium mastoideum]|nr:MAG: hypothetical protein M1821_000394 [Bathelium mastoideum]
MATASTQLPRDVSPAALEQHTASAVFLENDNGSPAHSQSRQPRKPPSIEIHADANPSSVDSAYASTSTTPDSTKKTLGPHDNWSTHTRASSISSLSERILSKVKSVSKKRTIKAFPDREISEELDRRFYSLKELYNKPLLEVLRNGGGDPRPILVKLVYLGEDESSSKPYVVVVCDKGVAHKVRRLFRSRWFQEHCRDPNGVGPTLQAIVYDREGAPKLFSGEHVFMAPNALYNDKRGSLLAIGDQQGKHLITLGGFIDADGALLGLTCGHWKYQRCRRPAEDGERENDKINDEEETEDDDMVEDITIELPLSALDIPTQYVNPTESEDVNLNRSFLRRLDKLCDLGYSHSGTVLATSFDEESDGINRDWALIDIPRFTGFWNSIIPLSSENILEKNQGSTKQRYREPFVSARRAAVLIGGGASGPISGTLSFRRSLFWIPGSTGFTEVYSVSNLESSLLEGDCGAWVRDKNNKVYGHFVAAGPLNEYYIIPIEDTLASIQERLSANTVKIASSQDVSTWHGTAAHPINSEAPSALSVVHEGVALCPDAELPAKPVDRRDDMQVHL